MFDEFAKRLQTFSRKKLAVGTVLMPLVAAAVYNPTPAEWVSLTFQPVAERAFRAEYVTEGRIAIDEDRSTPVFSPYTGRVTRLLVRPGDSVVRGQPLFVIEAADTVQAQNDHIAAMAALNKAKSAVDLAEIQNKRTTDL